MQVNRTDIDWTEYEHGRNTFRRKQLGDAAGADQLGCSLYELPPGKESWPYHYHTANEEALFVLDGEGTLRTEDGTRALQAGDFVALAADESGAHQVRNDNDRPLRYLMVSTMQEPDVTVYPEMETFGVFVGAPPGGRGERSFHGFYDTEADVEYWEES